MLTYQAGWLHQWPKSIDLKLCLGALLALAGIACQTKQEPLPAPSTQPAKPLVSTPRSNTLIDDRKLEQFTLAYADVLRLAFKRGVLRFGQPTTHTHSRRNEQTQTAQIQSELDAVIAKHGLAKSEYAAIQQALQLEPELNTRFNLLLAAALGITGATTPPDSQTIRRALSK